MAETVERKTRTRGNGQGTAFKRGSTWTAQVSYWVTVDGKKVRKYKTKGGFKLKREALAYIDELQNGGSKLGSIVAFNALYDEWSIQHFPRVTRDTKDGYKGAYDKCWTIHHRQFVGLKTIDLQRVVDTAKTKDGKELSRRTKANIKSLFSNMYKYALQNDIVDKDYSDFVVLPKKEKSKKDAFTDAEIELLWKDYEARNEFTGYILIMIYTGMRYGEISTVKKENVHLAEKYLVGGIKTEAGIDREIPLNDRIIPIIEKFYNQGKKKILEMHEKVFYNEFYAALERAGVRKLPPHSCRHTAATALANAGASPAVIIAILGHKDYATTIENYTHIKLEEKLKAINQL